MATNLNDTFIDLEFPISADRYAGFDALVRKNTGIPRDLRLMLRDGLKSTPQFQDEASLCEYLQGAGLLQYLDTDRPLPGGPQWLANRVIHDFYLSSVDGPNSLGQVVVDLINLHQSGTPAPLMEMAVYLEEQYR